MSLGNTEHSEDTHNDRALRRCGLGLCSINLWTLHEPIDRATSPVIEHTWSSSAMSCSSETRPRSCPLCAIRRSMASIWRALSGLTSAIRATGRVCESTDQRDAGHSFDEDITHVSLVQQCRGRWRANPSASAPPLLASHRHLHPVLPHLLPVAVAGSSLPLGSRPTLGPPFGLSKVEGICDHKDSKCSTGFNLTAARRADCSYDPM